MAICRSLSSESHRVAMAVAAETWKSAAYADYLLSSREFSFACSLCFETCYLLFLLSQVGSGDLCSGVLR